MTRLHCDLKGLVPFQDTRSPIDNQPETGTNFKPTDHFSPAASKRSQSTVDLPVTLKVKRKERSNRGMASLIAFYLLVPYTYTEPLTMSIKKMSRSVNSIILRHFF